LEDAKGIIRNRTTQSLTEYFWWTVHRINWWVGLWC